PAASVVAEPVLPPAPSPFVPQIVHEKRDFAKELADNQAAKLALKEKYKSDGLDDDEYEAQFDQLQEAKVGIQTAQALAIQAQQMNEQLADQSWEYVQRQFFAAPENASIQTNRLLFGAWQEAMQQVVNEAALANRQITDWELMHGARRMLADAGMLTPATSAAAPAPAVPGAAAPAPTTPPAPNRNPPLQNVPPTLAFAPSAASPGQAATADELAGLSIEDLEERLARSTEDDRDKILKAAPGMFASN
ncbi:MAG: hypothetical protein ACREP7_00750, partial [Lysobacter sp.]